MIRIIAKILLVMLVTAKVVFRFDNGVALYDPEFLAKAKYVSNEKMTLPVASRMSCYLTYSKY